MNFIQIFLRLILIMNIKLLIIFEHIIYILIIKNLIKQFNRLNLLFDSKINSRAIICINLWYYLL
jgi:hypothetical protein